MKRFLLLVLFLFSLYGYAQNLNYIKYNTNNSRLPHDIIYQIRQDDKGFLWICTDDGLVRFDGLQMVKFENGLHSQYIISTDEECGHIWAATWKGGLHRMENDSFVLYSSTELKVQTYNTNHVIVFNNLLIAGNFKDYYTFRIDTVEKKLRPFAMLAGPREKEVSFNEFLFTPADKGYLKFIKTSDHRLLAYNHSGIYNIVNEKPVLLTAAVQPDEIREGRDRQFYIRLGKDIYICDANFKMIRMIYRFPAKQYPGKTLFSFHVLPSGNLCLGIEKADLHLTFYLVNTRTGEISDLVQDVKSEAAASYMHIDKEGGLWLSTDGDGIYHIFDRKYQLIGKDKIYKSTTINDLYRHTDGTLFIGTKAAVYSYRDKTLTYMPGPGNEASCFINRFFLTEAGEVAASVKNVEPPFPSFIVGRNPIPVKKYRERTALKSYVVVYGHSPSGTNTITYTGHVPVKSRSVPKPGIINTFTEDSTGNLWVGSGDGLYQYHPVRGLKKHTGFGNHTVNDLKFQLNKGLWIGTNNGLYLLHDEGIDYWGSEKGLTNLNVTCIYVQSANSLWIGTQNGLFNLKDGKMYIYKKRSGLISDDVSCLEAVSADELAVGSSKGVSFVYMNEARPVQKAPDILMEKILINGIPHKEPLEVEVPFNSTLSFNFNAVTLVYPELLSFEYRMNPDEPWIKTQNRSLVFTNLEPGRYQFQLRAKKFDSNFGAATIFPLDIAYPWWRSWYFYILLVLMAGGVAYFIFSWRLSRQKDLAKVKQQLSELKLKALQAQLNPHFISNSLNTIQYYSLKKDEISANQYLTQFADLTRLVLETSRSRFIPLSTELEILRLYLALEKLRFENKFDFKIDVDPELDLERVHIPGMLIQPFAENSVNHGIGYLDPGKSGTLLISMSMEGDFLRVLVDDNGIGRDKAREMKSRIKKIYRSVSTEIVEELRDVVNEMSGNRIEIHTTDKFDIHHQPSGTSVLLMIKISGNLITSDH